MRTLLRRWQSWLIAMCALALVVLSVLPWYRIHWLVLLPQTGGADRVSSTSAWSSSVWWSTAVVLGLAAAGTWLLSRGSAPQWVSLLPLLGVALIGWQWHASRPEGRGSGAIAYAYIVVSGGDAGPRNGEPITFRPFGYSQLDNQSAVQPAASIAVVVLLILAVALFLHRPARPEGYPPGQGTGYGPLTVACAAALVAVSLLPWFRIAQPTGVRGSDEVTASAWLASTRWSVAVVLGVAAAGWWLHRRTAAPSRRWPAVALALAGIAALTWQWRDATASVPRVAPLVTPGNVPTDEQIRPGRADPVITHDRLRAELTNATQAGVAPGAGAGLAVLTVLSVVILTDPAGRVTEQQVPQRPAGNEDG